MDFNVFQNENIPKREIYIYSLAKVLSANYKLCQNFDKFELSRTVCALTVYTKSVNCRVLFHNLFIIVSTPPGFACLMAL